MRSLSLIIISCFVISCTPKKAPRKLMVDDLSAYRTQAQLEQEFGKERVREIEHEAGDDKNYNGFYLFPASDSSVEFMTGAKGDFSAVRITTPKWKTNNGIKLGMSMKNLIDLNGIHFEINREGRATLPYPSSWGSQMFVRFDGMSGFFATHPDVISVNTNSIDPKDQEGLYLVELLMIFPERQK